MKCIEEKVQDQYKEAHLEHMRNKIQLIKKKKRKNETAQTIKTSHPISSIREVT